MAFKPEGSNGTLEKMDENSLEKLKEYKDILKEAISDSITRSADLTKNQLKVRQDLVSEINELQIVIEPSPIEINDLDKQIQAGMKQLRLNTELINELKVSRAFVARIRGMLMINLVCFAN